MRKSISVAFFSLVSTLMVLGIVLMGFSEWVLFKGYFAKDRYETLDQVVGVAERTAQYLVQKAALPEGDELEALSTKLEIIGESAEAYLFFTDNDGNVMLASNPDMLNDAVVDIDFRTSANAAPDPDGGERYHLFSDLDGTLTEKSYIAVVRLVDSQSYPSGWLFLCSSGRQLTEFKQQFWSNFLLSACVMLLCASILTKILMRQLTDPLQKVTDAAQRFGGGDLSVRVEGVEGEGEVADLARTFNRMADNIQMNDNSRGQFMGNIAHELRTPMTTIKGFVDGILDGTIPPDMQNHYLQLVSEETGRLARLIQNMLDLSKLESGTQKLERTEFDIAVKMEEIAHRYQGISEQMGYHLHFTPDASCMVYCDEGKIERVICNLIHNAINYTSKEDRQIFLRQINTPEGVRIEVTDTGDGIEEDKIKLIFDKYYRSENHKREVVGTGLGLSIVKAILKLHNYHYGVNSKLGEGSTFWFVIRDVKTDFTESSSSSSKK